MKNLLATLTLGLSGAVLFSACAPDQYAQQSETDDLYFTAADRNSVEVVKLNDPNKASYDKSGSYVYQEEVASKNFNPDAVDVNRYTSDQQAEETQAEYYVTEEDRQLNQATNNQFNGARASNATFGNPAFMGAGMWNDPFYNPYWGRAGWGTMGMGFYDPFWGPSMGFYDPFWGPAWGMRPGFNISFGFGFGNAWGYPGYGWGRPGFGWGRPWGWGGYTAGFYDGFYANPYNRFGYCPPAVVAYRNDVVIDNRTIVSGSRRASRTADRRRTTDSRAYASTRNRADYTASRDAYTTESKNPLYGRGRSRTASGTTSASTRYRSASPTQSTATRSSRSYTPARVQRPSSTANSTYSPRTRSTAPSQTRRYNSGSNSNYSRSYGNSSRSRSYGSGSSSYGSTRSRGSSSYGSSPSRSRSSGSYSSGSRSRGGSSYSGGSSRGRRGGGR